MEKICKVEIAKEFISRFTTGNIEGLEELLQEDLYFKGPLLKCNTRTDYLDSLRDNPPNSSEFKILSVIESDDEVSIFYEYRKEEGYLTVAQLFRFKSKKIAEIILVFDSKDIE